MKKMALVTCLAAFASLASALADGEAPPGANEPEVTCSQEGEAQPTERVKIAADQTTFTLKCPDKYTAQPAPPESGSPYAEQMVYSGEDCEAQESLKTYCKGATGELAVNKRELKLVFPTERSGSADFCLKCDPDPANEAKKVCTVRVHLQSKAPPGDNGSSSGGGNQQPGSGQEEGPAGVQTCLRRNKTITVRVPEKGSVAQFACESGSTLYPTERDKIFSKDCRTQETLKDITRTQTTGGATSVSDAAPAPTYTLTADKKPAKKTLCYLCATAGTGADDPGTAEKYCTVYVESGAAGTQLGLSFIVALTLPCVPAAFQFT